MLIDRSIVTFFNSEAFNYQYQSYIENDIFPIFIVGFISFSCKYYMRINMCISRSTGENMCYRKLVIMYDNVVGIYPLNVLFITMIKNKKKKQLCFLILYTCII